MNSTSIENCINYMTFCMQFSIRITAKNCNLNNAVIHNSVYSPEEDSYFLSEILKKQLNKIKEEDKINLKFLEIGSGSGIQLEAAINSGIKKQNIFSCDINPEAVKHCKSLGFNCIKSDLFSNIKNKRKDKDKFGKFDIIIFNPPYLPEDKFDKIINNKDVSGGKKGDETIIKFLKQAKHYLNKGGFIILLTSSLTPKINFKEYNYKPKLLKNKKLFFEEIFVWKLY